MFLRILLISTLILLASKARAQLYSGITVDVGNRIAYSPTSPDGLLKRPVMPSASIVLLMNSRIARDWLLKYGIAFGSLGYNVKAIPYDTLPDTTPDPYNPYESFPSYGTLYVSGNLLVGHRFTFDDRYLDVSVGCGMSAYRDWSDEGGFGRSREVMLFEYQMARADNKPKGFIEFDMQTNVGAAMVLGLRYRHHFNPALQGTYNFDHAQSSGQLSLAQRAISIVVLVRITSGR